MPRASAGRNADPGGVGPGGGKFEVDDRTEEGVGHLQQDAGTVPGVGLGAGCTAVLHVRQGLQAREHEFVGANAVQVGHEGHTTRVVFVPRVVQADGAGGLLHHHIHEGRS